MSFSAALPLLVAFAFIAPRVVPAQSPQSQSRSNAQAQAKEETAPITAAAPVDLTAEQDHKRMMDLLHITALRPGADAHDPASPHAVNYDESKANPYPNLPDPLRLNNGKRVTSAKQWQKPAPSGASRDLRPRDPRPRTCSHARCRMEGRQRDARVRRQHSHRHQASRRAG